MAMMWILETERRRRSMERAARCAPWFLPVLLLLGGLFLADVCPRMGPSELEAATHPPGDFVCLNSGSAALMDRSAIDGAGPAPESGDAGELVRADCGAGEAWRRHVP